MEATRRPAAAEAGDRDISDDVRLLHSLGYAQELRRRMSVFSNFAISFSIICILAGGITSFQLGFAAGRRGLDRHRLAARLPVLADRRLLDGPDRLGLPDRGRPLPLGVDPGRARLGLGHGVDQPARPRLRRRLGECRRLHAGARTCSGRWSGSTRPPTGSARRSSAVVLITASQALFNHLGIRVTTLLTDFSGYLIFAVAIVLTAALLATAPSLDFSRLVTFANFTGTNFPGDAANAVWPNAVPLWVAFALGLLLPAYTITGFDASAHTSEETVNAQRSVPRGMINAVVWSAVFGYVMVCSFVLAMPDTTEGAKQGANVFFWVMDQSSMAKGLKDLLYVGIVLSNYLCALAGMTSFSRMVFAFARDGGLPFSRALRHVSPTYRTPVNAIWASALLAVAATLYTPAFATLAAGCAVFLYLSYAMPVAAGLLAEGRTWTRFGPFRLGALSKPFAVITTLGAIGLLIAGIQPPNDALVTYGLGMLALLLVGWFALERRRFPGPPVGAVIERRQAEIAAEERAVLQS